MNEALEPVERIAKGYLNGTTRKQGYAILAITAVSGAVSGAVAVRSLIRRRYDLVPKAVQPAEPVVVVTQK